MKKIFYSLLAFAAMASCTESGGGDIDVATTRAVSYGVDSPAVIDITVAKSVVSVSGGSLITQWSDGDQLGGWSSEGLYAFDEKSVDGAQAVSSARFESSISSSVTKLRLFSPYASSVSLVDGCYPLDLGSQIVNSASPYSNVGDYSVMISDEFGVELFDNTSMRHLGSFVNLAFAMSDFGRVVDGEVVSAEIVGLASQGALNISGGALQSVERAPIVVTFDGALSMDRESFAIPVAALPLDFAQGDSLSVNVNYKSAGKMESKRFVYNFEDSFSLGAAIYHQFTLKPVAPADLELVNGVYQLYSASDLMMFAQKVNEGEGDIDAKLMNDINLASVCGASLGNWTPIGAQEGSEYRGTFDGADHKIRGLYIKDMMGRMQGLFGYVDGGVIKNLDLFGSVTSFGISGGFAGYIKGEIINCINYVTINGAGNEFGGIAGRVGDGSKVVNCRNMMPVKGASLVGGIAGSVGAGSDLVACLNNKTITHGTATSVVWGGIVGDHGDSTKLIGCLDMASDVVSGSADTVGVVDCYASTDMTVFDEYVVWCMNNSIARWNKANGRVLKRHYKFVLEKYPEFVVGEPEESTYDPRIVIISGDSTVVISHYEEKQIFLRDDATLTLTGDAASILQDSKISIESPKARLYLPNIKRGDWNGANLASSIMINNSALNDGVNAQVLGYYDNLYVKSKIAGHKPAMLYGGGDSAGVDEYTVYTGSSIPLGDNKIERIVLERGYQIVVADDVKGIIASRCYIAIDEDLEIVLDDKLKGKVSFLRVIPFTYVTKRGICGKSYPDVLHKQLDLSWYYNWGSGVSSTPDLDFVPMFWAGWATSDASIEQVIAKKYTPAILAFNEPDNDDQANMTVEKALDAYEKMLRMGMRMGTPATCQVGGSSAAWAGDPNKWINQFIAGAKERGYRMDFIAIHWYDVANAKNLTPKNVKQSVDRLKAHLDACYKKHGLPIWLTEFNCGSHKTQHSDPSVTSIWQVYQPYIELVVPMLEAHPAVERYALYSPEGFAPLVSGDEPSTYGYSYIKTKSTPSIVNPAN